MCDNEAFEFAEVTPLDESDIAEPLATAREITIDIGCSTANSSQQPMQYNNAGRGPILLVQQKMAATSVQYVRQDQQTGKSTLTFGEFCSRGVQPPETSSLSQSPAVLQQLSHHYPMRCVSALEQTTTQRPEAVSALTATSVLTVDSAVSRKSVSAKPSARSYDPEASTVPASHGGGLVSQLASVLGRGPPRLSFVDRARAYRHQQQQQLASCLQDNVRVFGQLLESVPYTSGDVSNSGSPLISIEKLHNLMAERRHATAIVDCREDGETSRLDLSHLITFSASDLLEADSQQLERINKTHRFLILVSNLTTCPREDLLTLRDCMVRHLQVCCNSCSLSVHVLDCDINLAAYLGGSSPVPTVFEDAIYLLPEQHFVLSNDSLALYESVLTDSKSVEKFCHFQASKRVACLRVSSFLEDAEAALWLMRRTEEKDECALLCFSCLTLGKALVVAYTMWKHRHLLRDAVKRVRDAWAAVDLDSSREKELLDVEKRLFSPTLA